GQDAFVAKVKNDGTDVVYSTYLGGDGDDGGYGVAIDQQGRPYVTGQTCQPSSGTDFPTTAGVFAGIRVTGCDGFATRLVEDTSTGNLKVGLSYSTFLGGTGDWGNGIAVDLLDQAYVVGSADSSWLAPLNGFQTTFGGGIDGYLAVLDANGASVTYSTYIGGSGTDQAWGVAVRGLGAVVVGDTYSTDFPLPPSSGSSNSGGSDAFATVIDVTATGAASLVDATYWGGSSDDLGWSVSADPLGAIHMAGFTHSTDFPVTSDAMQPSNNGGWDAFETTFYPCSGIMTPPPLMPWYSTYWGTTGDDAGTSVGSRGGQFGQGNDVFLAGYAEDGMFTSPGAFQVGNAGGLDGFVTDTFIELPLCMSPPPTGGGGTGPGHVAKTFETTVASSVDFKGGVGIEDPDNPDSACTAALLGVRGSQPVSKAWEADQNLGTNLNGPGFGISNLVPLLSPVPGHPSQGGINLGIACPIPGSDPGNLWLIWSGMNWRSIEADSSTQINLCTQQTFASSSPGCLAVPGSNLDLIVSACGSLKGPATTFGHNYLDGRGKEVNGLPFDTLAMKNQAISCTPIDSVDYTGTVQSFGGGSASQTFERIKNEAVVHAGAGTRYMAICWSIDYVDFTNPLAPLSLVATAHDWKLIIDVGDPAGVAGIAAAIVTHYGAAQAGDGGVGPATTALRGFYDFSGDNGFGPCPGWAPAPATKKPSPLI
ncbi:MAG: hypothetical protein LC623_08265, partial [Halobacteriales archaeon]|nr:hypothetical protein [Halobacteriales archaeon]